MKTRFATPRRPALVFAVTLVVTLTAVAAHAAESRTPAPARVENGVKETELATLHLTP